MDDYDEAESNNSSIENGVWYAFKCPVCLVEQSAWWLRGYIEMKQHEPLETIRLCPKCNAELKFTVDRHTKGICTVERNRR